MKFFKPILSFIGFEYSTYHLQLNLSAVPKETPLKISSGESILNESNLPEPAATIVVNIGINFDEFLAMFTEVHGNVKKNSLADVPLCRNEIYPPVEIRIKEKLNRFKIPKKINPTRTPQRPQSRHGRR